LLFAALAVIVGCSSDNEAVPATTASQPVATTAPQADATKAPPAKEEPATPAGLAELKDVPRNRTLVFTHWSGSYRTQHDNVENFNSWLPGNSHSRQAQNKGQTEYMFYTNLNNGELIPWQGESFEYNDTFDSIDVVLRDGVKWSDGVAFTANDVKFTIDMVIANSPDLNRSSAWLDMIKDVVVDDDLHFTINLNRPDPRFFINQFGLGHENHTAIVAKHVWENEDPLTFTNYDPAKGWPLGTGAFELVRTVAPNGGQPIPALVTGQKLSDSCTSQWLTMMLPLSCTSRISLTTVHPF
jgi:ABC-type transport system substrate-binding protein